MNAVIPRILQMTTITIGNTYTGMDPDDKAFVDALLEELPFIFDGENDGFLEVGSNDGDEDGSDDGSIEGSTVGISEGPLVGLELGSLLG